MYLNKKEAKKIGLSLLILIWFGKIQKKMDKVKNIPYTILHGIHVSSVGLLHPETMFDFWHYFFALWGFLKEYFAKNRFYSR